MNAKDNAVGGVLVLAVCAVALCVLGPCATTANKSRPAEPVEVNNPYQLPGWQAAPPTRPERVAAA